MFPLNIFTFHRFRDFEAASGYLLNRNRKSTIIGPGSWAGRLDWPLQWLLASEHVKVLGFIISPGFSNTVQLSWDSVLTGMEQTLRSWRSRRLETLLLRVSAMEVFVFSKAWYTAHLLPLATSASSPGLEAPATCLCRLASDFLWAGHLRRMAFDECHAKRSAGGLGLRQGPIPCWPSKPATYWRLEAAQLYTWPTGLVSASTVSSQGWPLPASG